MSDLCTQRARDLIRARRVEIHPPTLLICPALGRLPNVEGARPTLFSAYRPNERAGTPQDAPALKSRAMGRIEHTLLDGANRRHPNRPKTFARNPPSQPHHTTKSYKCFYLRR